MIANSLFLTIAILLALGFWLLGELKFFIPYKGVLFHEYGTAILIYLATLFLNLFAAAFDLKAAGFKEGVHKWKDDERAQRSEKAQSTGANDRAVNSGVVLISTNNRLQHLRSGTSRIGIKVDHRATFIAHRDAYAWPIDESGRARLAEQEDTSHPFVLFEGVWPE